MNPGRKRRTAPGICGVLLGVLAGLLLFGARVAADPAPIVARLEWDNRIGEMKTIVRHLLAVEAEIERMQARARELDSQVNRLKISGTLLDRFRLRSRLEEYHAVLARLDALELQRRQLLLRRDESFERTEQWLRSGSILPGGAGETAGADTASYERELLTVSRVGWERAAKRVEELKKELFEAPLEEKEAIRKKLKEAQRLRRKEEKLFKDVY